LGRPRFKELFFAVKQRVDVVWSEFDTVAVGDGVGRAGFDTVAAENATRIIDVVDLGISFAGRNAIGVRIFGGFDVNAVRGARGGAQKAAYALLVTVLIALQYMNAAITRLYAGRNFGEILGRRRTENRPQCDAKALEKGYKCFPNFLDQRGHRTVL